MKATILTLTLTVALSTPVSADWALYTNTDNKSWFLAKSFFNKADCEKAARALVAEKQALGAGCSDWSPDATLQQAQEADARAAPKRSMERAKENLRELARETRDLNRKIEQDIRQEQPAAPSSGRTPRGWR